MSNDNVEPESRISWSVIIADDPISAVVFGIVRTGTNQFPSIHLASSTREGAGDGHGGEEEETEREGV